MIYNAYTEQKEEIQGITLVSCGHIFAQAGREIYRPKGREDWLLFYVAKESETFFLETPQSGAAGSFIIFAPGEAQHHIYKGNSTAEFYYIHFKTKQLPMESQLETSKLYHLPFNRQICDIFEDIIAQTSQKAPYYERLGVYRFLYLLTLLERDVTFDNHPYKENFERIAKALQHMNKNYDSHLSLEDYAKMCTISKYHFIRIFEKIVGHPPLEYRNNIRLEHAAFLISEEKLSINEIAAQVGYSSASYFSSAFKKKYGVSPKQYQKHTV